MILAGLWFSQNKPLFNMFFATLETDLKELCSGVDFEIANSLNKLTMRAQINSGTCDLPAKSLVLNMMQYNAKHGCPTCKIETFRVDNVQNYSFTENFEIRTTNESLLDARIVHATKFPVFGVKGSSVISKFVSDYINSTGIDVMHCVYQGITKNCFLYCLILKNFLIKKIFCVKMNIKNIYIVKKTFLKESLIMI